MGDDTQPYLPFDAYRSYTDFHRHEKAFDWLCRPIQSASSSPRPSFSESTCPPSASPSGEAGGYKSILCQQDPYLLELVRYIHLNPLRARLVPDYKSLKRFSYGGHCVLMGKCNNDWQNTEYILSLFGQKVSAARRLYSKFVEEGVSDGKRPELVGGGLIRSLGGWASAKALRGTKDRIKGDERILGDGNFVKEVLESCKQQLERRYHYQAQGYDFDWLVGQVATLFGVDQDIVTRPGRYPDTVEARSVLCYWAARELGISTLELSKRLGISQPTASQSVKRGEKIVKEKQLKVMG